MQSATMATPHPMRDWYDSDQARGAVTRRANRRRLLVFLGTFVTFAVVGLLWCFLRPAEYRATSRLLITPAVAMHAAESAASAGGSEADRAFLTEVQSLSSRPLIEQVARRLRSAGRDLAYLGSDPVAALQRALTVTPMPGTNVVELAAVGSRPEVVAALLVDLADAYREHIAQSYSDDATRSTALVAEEADKLEAAVAEKRREMESFRVRYNIVSPEREENSVLAEMQGLSANMRDAHKRVAEAEGKLNALRTTAAEGKGVVRARDDPTLANLEQGAAQVRQSLRELERQFTPTYLAMDPQARSLRARLAELEEQIKVQREVGSRNALTQAEEDLASARAAVDRLEGQISDGRQRVGQFASRFGQYKSLNDELKELEKTYQAALQRKALVEATERERMPAMQALEQAAMPTEPWRPLYGRDAAIVVGASLLIALVAMWLVELFNRREPPPSVVVAQPVFAGALGGPQQQGLGFAPPWSPALAANELPLLAPARMLPRELTVDESAALLRAADPDTRRAVALLLAGLTPEEVMALRWRDLDPANGTLQVAGSAPRVVQIPAASTRLFERATDDDERPVVPGPPPAGATQESLASRLLCAAHDAGLDRIQEVSPAAVRHTYISFLVRQGARFADIMGWVGPVDPDLLPVYSDLAPGGDRLDAVAVRRSFPAFDLLAQA
jgi:succinoglycan biosynthesis transport protein ExoP